MGVDKKAFMIDSEFILIVVCVLIVALVMIALLSISQLARTKQVLAAFSDRHFEKVNVQFLLSRQSKFRVTAGVPIMAVLYLAEDVIVIAPKEKGYLRGSFHIGLPIVLGKHSAVIKSTNLTDVVVPDSVTLSSFNAILIKYRTHSTIDISTSIQLKLLDKADLEKVATINSWAS